MDLIIEMLINQLLNMVKQLKTKQITRLFRLQDYVDKNEGKSKKIIEYFILIYYHFKGLEFV